MKLHFGRDAQLSKVVPSRWLRGRGETLRHVELHPVADCERPEIEALLVATLQLAELRLGGACDPNAVDPSGAFGAASICAMRWKLASLTEPGTEPRTKAT